MNGRTIPLTKFFRIGKSFASVFAPITNKEDLLFFLNFIFAIRLPQLIYSAFLDTLSKSEETSKLLIDSVLLHTSELKHKQQEDSNNYTFSNGTS